MNKLRGSTNNVTLNHITLLYVFWFPPIKETKFKLYMLRKFIYKVKCGRLNSSKDQVRQNCISSLLGNSDHSIHCIYVPSWMSSYSGWVVNLRSRLVMVQHSRLFTYDSTGKASATRCHGCNFTVCYTCN